MMTFMQITSGKVFTVSAQHAQQTLAALLRHWLPGRSWSQVRKLAAERRVKINDEIWQDSARRLKEGDRVEVLLRSVQGPRLELVLRHVDEHVVVVEKPAGMATVRHPAERDWPARRRVLVPTLDDLVQKQLAGSLRGSREGSSRQARASLLARSRLRIVHRLDKETSGLVVFARTVEAERGLGRQFRKHTVIRKYLAIVPGTIEAQKVHTFLIRDQGDGRRGSSRWPGQGKEAVTHIEVVKHLQGYTLVQCRLETGRTHQIRIHLAELGHPVCGDKVYQRPFGQAPRADLSGAPRLALHAAELGFDHPISGKPLHWEMPLPDDLQQFLEKL